VIQLSAVSKYFGEKTLFEGADWLLTPGDRVGLVGANGTGKTTLLRMLAGLEPPDHGQITRVKGSTVGYLPQEGLSHSGRSVFDECLSVFDELLSMQAEQHDLSDQMAALPHDSDEYRRAADRFGALQHQLQVHDAYALDARVGTVLHGLGFATGEWQRPCETFSGGWQMRIALAKLLLARPNVLLLDEPTNHLDLEARNWLEEYLGSYPHAFVLVSHDRFFLDVTVRKVVELWNRRLHFYSGSYSDYLRQREQRREQLMAEHRNQQDRIQHLQTFINRFRYTATKAAQVQSRIKELEKIERIEIPPEERTITFRFPQPPAGGRSVVEGRNVAKSYDGKLVFAGVNFTIERGDRIALVGANGAGKSTLIKLLAGTEKPTEGEIRYGHNLRTDYFAQDQYRALDPSRSLIEDLGSLAPAATQTYLRTLLGCFLFRDEEVFKPIGVLSGGERNRYAMARLLLIPSNFLLLDEPTNHLDLRAKDVLLDALRDFSGTMVFVSHDRYFIDGLATRVFEIGGGGLSIYAGNYEDYLRQKAGVPEMVEADPAAAQKAGPAELAVDVQPSSDGPRRINPIRQQQMRERAAEIEEEVARLEAEAAELQSSLQHTADYSQTQERLQRLMQCNEQIEGLYHEWEELQAVL
jgi:ATP-binding cassette, subfamily F, member 3